MFYHLSHGRDKPTYQVVLREEASLVEVVLDHVEEVGILGFRDVLEPLRNLPRSGRGGGRVEAGSGDPAWVLGRGWPDQTAARLEQ